MGYRPHPYSFSKSENSQTMGFQISKELYDRIQVICNLTEMNQSTLCRYIIKRGITEMEEKLAQLLPPKTERLLPPEIKRQE